MKASVFWTILVGALFGIYFLSGSFGVLFGAVGYLESWDKSEIQTQCLMVPNGQAILNSDKAKCQAVLDFYKSKGRSGTRCLDELFPASNIIIKNTDLVECSLSMEEHQANLLKKSLNL
ncbi:hypothetical protein [uncultured Shewanella sp.]|uniref:hypothetical protein n=1 Tax=uncultured Shewanella sp. TaxID=173975 RepID=UPI00263A0F58|nr:hypothetical protein [uncultured Shewanella sp.]